jgi:hypothetical protein
MLILQSRPIKRRSVWRRRLLWLLVPVVGVAGWLSWAPALDRYHVWKQNHALAQARNFIAQHDPENARMALQVAFTVAPGNIDVWRAAADMLEQVGSPETMRIRHHVVQMMGANLRDEVALINSDLRFRDFNAARDALAGVPKNYANDPEVLGAALSFALATENDPMADALYDRLKAAVPNNEDFKVAQAILRLRHPNARQAEAARNELEAYASNPKYALRAARELMLDAVGRQDFAGAKHWTGVIAADPKSTLGDRLHQANLQILVDKKPFAEIFPPLALKAAENPDDIVPFVRWLLVQNRAAEADRWLSGLPAPLRSGPSVVAAEADAVAQLKDWDRLGHLLEAGAWGAVPPEAVQLALSARLVGGRSVELQHEVWDQALEASSSNLAGLIVLERLTNLWLWEAESEKTLWTIARAFPDQTWVDQQLFNAYRGRNDTTNMRGVMDVLRNADPTVPRYQHDWALLSLLLDPTPAWDRPKEIMHELYISDETNPDYITGYAFALAQAGKGPQALAIAGKLPLAEQNYSPRAPYLAFIFGVAGKKSEITRFETMARSTPYLPEERSLFEMGREAAPPKPPSPPAASKVPPRAGS